MKLKFGIKLLAECPEYVDDLAQLWFEELGRKWIPNASVDKAKKTYEEHLNNSNLPLTFVGVHEDKPIAMCSLRDNDGIRGDLTPWLGSLIVHPEYRGRGIGEGLIEITKQCAKAMQYEKLYLLTLDPNIPIWYQKLGWNHVGEDKLYHHSVKVMEIKT